MTTALIGFAVLMLLCFIGFRVGFATLMVGFVGFALERGLTAALAMTGQQVLEDAMNYNLSVIPLFVLMGVFIYESDVSSDLFDSAYALMGRFRGGLALATVIACGGFSAVCGSTLATAATMSKVAMPPMRRFNYSDSLATGTIAAGGTLGIMIPPSVPLVIYGIVAQQDVGKLFMAGVVPGLLLMMLFLGAVMVTVRLDATAGPVGAPLEPARRRAAFRGIWPVASLFLLVLGGIYGGVFTATEAAGIGAVGAAAIAFLRGRLRNFADWRHCLVDATRTTAKLFIVIFGALVFAQFINMSGMPADILDTVEDLSLNPLQLVVFVVLVAIVMGTVFESIGILLLLVPVFLPALYASGIDMIWFGILVVIVTELGLITPPIGMNVFVVKSIVPDVRLADIFRGVAPFGAALIVALLLMFLIPGLATSLPALMR